MPLVELIESEEMGDTGVRTVEWCVITGRGIEPARLSPGAVMTEEVSGSRLTRRISVELKVGTLLTREEAIPACRPKDTADYRGRAEFRRRRLFTTRSRYRVTVGGLQLIPS